MLTTYFSQKVRMKWYNWIYSLSNCRKRRRQIQNIDETRLSAEKILTWCSVAHDLAATQVLVHDTNIQNTRACVQCKYIDTLLHRLTTWTTSSELWQRTRHRIAAVLLTDNRCPPAVASTPWCHHMAENRTSHDQTVIGYIVHYVMWNGSSVTLHDYTDFFRGSRRNADEIQKKDHIFGDYLEECTQGCMLSPGHTFLFNSLQRRSPLYDMLCTQAIWAM